MEKFITGFVCGGVTVAVFFSFFTAKAYAELAALKLKFAKAAAAAVKEAVEAKTKFHV